MSTTIKDVARHAGVSTATVSRVFNDSGPVGNETRERVVLVAKQLRYSPNLLGRSLSIRRSDAIGLLLPDLHGEFFSEVIRGADETLQRRHLHLIVSSSHSSREDLDAALRVLRGRVDGLIIMSPHVDAQVLTSNLPHHLPVVLLNCNAEGYAYDSLTIDNFGGAWRVANHILGHGHARIAIITGSPDNHDAVERLRGYRTALAENPAVSAVEIPGNFTEASGYDAVRRILQKAPLPTAMIASNDAMAVGALSALTDAGVAIPDSMALAGFDDIPIAAWLTPSLTTVSSAIYDIGVRAVEAVLDAVGNKGEHRRQQQTLPVTLRVRESCGCSMQKVHE
jgi:LacI family transcriptional regulator